MARYFSVFLVLAILAGASIFSWSHISDRYGVILADYNVSKTAYDRVDMEAKGLSRRAAEVTRFGSDVNKFLSAWSLLAQEGTEGPGPVGNRLSSLAKTHGLLTLRLPTPKREDYPFAGSIASVQLVGFSVTGPYSQIMAWLGEVEDSFVFARVESVEISPSGTAADVELVLNLAFLADKEPAK